jgi:hypothetical protein
MYRLFQPKHGCLDALDQRQRRGFARGEHGVAICFELGNVLVQVKTVNVLLQALGRGSTDW